MCRSNSSLDVDDIRCSRQGWQRIDQKDIPCTIKSLAKDEIILSFNIIGSCSTHQEEITSFRVNHNDLLTTPTLVSELLSQTSMAFFADYAEMVKPVIDRVKSHQVSSSNRVVTVNMTLVYDDHTSPDDDDDEDQDQDQDDPESEASKDINHMSASVEFLKGFDAVEIEGGGLEEDGLERQHCSICLEGFSEGSKATRMPCSYLYHRACIFQWLAKGDSCPLCPGIPERG